jgi:hypothetical protein
MVTIIYLIVFAIKKKSRWYTFLIISSGLKGILTCLTRLKLGQILLDFWHLIGKDLDRSEASFGRRYIELIAAD